MGNKLLRWEVKILGWGINFSDGQFFFSMGNKIFKMSNSRKKGKVFQSLSLLFSSFPSYLENPFTVKKAVCDRLFQVKFASLAWSKTTG